MSAPLHATVLVPGLFGPLRSLPAGDEAARVLLSGLETHTVETLLTRADHVPGRSGEGIATSLFAAFGLFAEGDDVPAAALTRQADAGDAGRGWHLRADPVHLRAGMNEATLIAQGRPPPGLAVTDEETPLLLAAVNEALAEEGLQVEALAPGRWYVRLEAPSGARFTSVYELAGASLRDAMPSGEQGARWRRLLTATQTALFACPANAAREAAGAPPVNSLWFFGEGALPPAPAARFECAWTDHELAAAIAAHAGTPSRALPEDAAAWLNEAARGRHLLVTEDCHDADRRGDAGDWCAALDRLQRRWLTPLLEALRGGVLLSLQVDAGSAGCFRLDRRGLRRFWRRRRDLASLAAAA